MNITKLSCISCGSPINVPPDETQYKCPYCGTVQHFQRRPGQISASETNQPRLVESDATTTQTELKRLQLGQEASMLQLQLSTLQSEIRSLERQSPSKQIVRQLKELKTQEIDLTNRIKTIQATLSPQPVPTYQVASSTPSAQRLQNDIQERLGSIPFKKRVIDSTMVKSKSWLATYLLCLFFGFFGAHRFYTGFKLIGVLQLFSVGGMLIWWFIDLFAITLGKYHDSNDVIIAGPQSKVGRTFALLVSIAWSLYFIIAFFAVNSANQ